MGHQNLFHAPLTAMRPTTRETLGLMLDPKKIIPTDRGLLRDWRGLAELVGLGALKQGALEMDSGGSRTTAVLQQWQRLESPKVPANLGTLQQLLEELDRWDAVDDLRPLFEADAAAAAVAANAEPHTLSRPLGEKDAITIDDVDRISRGLPPQQYDVMLLYAEEDGHRAKKILDELEIRNIKVFIKARDLAPGVVEHDAVMDLIANRCNRIIVIYSNHLFQNDNLNSFLLSYAQCVGIETKRRKVIPVQFEPCQVPSKMTFNFRLDYTKTELFGNFYDRLYESVKPDHLPSLISTQKRSTTASAPVPSSPPEEEVCSSSLDSAYLSGSMTPELAEKRAKKAKPESPLPTKTKNSILHNASASLRKLVKKKKKSEPLPA